MKSILLGILAICALNAANGASSATPPEQPLSGPGGREVAHAQVIARSYGIGPQGYWLFEPAQPTPKQAPLIVFNHGWAAMDPGLYLAWINHLAERGNIVVYPIYQDNLFMPPQQFTANAVIAVRDAIRRLQNEPGHVRPQLDRFAIVGHSMGGDISANMAALWKQERLPFPRAVMCVEPGKSWGLPTWLDIELADLSKIPATTLLLTIAGDDDHIVRDIDAKRIFNESTQVPAANKNYISLVSDGHGEPALHADHMAPLAWAQMPEAADGKAATPLQQIPGTDEQRRATNHDMPDFTDTAQSVNALDYFGTWKLFDGLTDAAFFGTNRSYALGNTPEQRFMGVWSDGVPVRQLQVIAHP